MGPRGKKVNLNLSLEHAKLQILQNAQKWRYYTSNVTIFILLLETELKHFTDLKNLILSMHVLPQDKLGGILGGHHDMLGGDGFCFGTIIDNLFFIFKYPNDLYIFVIGVSYCIQAPYVIPFVMLYFGFGYVVHFYSMVYVMRPPFHSGGRMWPKIFNRWFYVTN